MRKLTITLISVFLFGCAAMRFTKPGTTNVDLQRDWTECDAMNGQAGHSDSMMATRNFMEHCMIGKGWTRK